MSKYELTDEKKKALGTAIRNRQPARRNTLTAIVEELMPDIDAARNNGVQWDDIATEFNRILGVSNKKDGVTGNTLSQAYVTVRKRVEEARAAKKATYEDLEQRVAELEKENDKLTKEVEKYHKHNV